MVANLLSFAKLRSHKAEISSAAVVDPMKPTHALLAAPVASVEKSAPTPAARSMTSAIEDDDEAEMHGASAASKARERERARCAAIFASAGATRNPVLAASLALNTSMSRGEPIATLDAMPAVESDTTASLSWRNPRHGVGRGKADNTHAQVAGWAYAMKQATKR